MKGDDLVLNRHEAFFVCFQLNENNHMCQREFWFRLFFKNLKSEESIGDFNCLTFNAIPIDTANAW